MAWVDSDNEPQDLTANKSSSKCDECAAMRCAQPSLCGQTLTGKGNWEPKKLGAGGRVRVSPVSAQAGGLALEGLSLGVAQAWVGDGGSSGSDDTATAAVIVAAAATLGSRLSGRQAVDCVVARGCRCRRSRVVHQYSHTAWSQQKEEPCHSDKQTKLDWGMVGGGLPAELALCEWPTRQ